MKTINCWQQVHCFSRWFSITLTLIKLARLASYVLLAVRIISIHFSLWMASYRNCMVTVAKLQRLTDLK